MSAEATATPQGEAKGIGPAFYLAVTAALTGILAQALLYLARQPTHLLRSASLISLGPWLALGLYLMTGGLAVLVSRTLWRGGTRTSSGELTLSLCFWDLLPALLSVAASVGAVVVLPGQRAPVAVWVLGGVALAGVLAGLYRLRGHGRPSERLGKGKPSGKERAAIVCVLLVAAALRAHALERVPSGIFFDEAMNGLEAAEIAERNVHPIWSDSLSGRPTLHLHILAAVFKLVGVRVFSMKWVSIAFGLLTVAATYRLGRDLFGGRTAVLAAVFLALARYHIHYSRIIFEAIMAPYLLVLAFCFLWRALRCRRWWDYVLSAMCTAAGLYTYVSFRVLPLIFVLFLLHRLLFERGFLRRHLPGLCCWVAVLALLLIPLARFAVNNPARFLTRYNEVSLIAEIKREVSLRPVIKNIAGYLSMFNFRGDTNRIQNLPGEPALSFFASIFFVWGLFVSLYRWHDPRYGGLVIWFLMGLLPGALTHSIETPHGTRVIATAPVVCLFAGLALRDVWQAIAGAAAPGQGEARRRTWVASGTAVVGAFLLATAALDYHAYFVRQAADPNCYFGFNPDANLVGRLIERWKQEYQIYVSPSYYYVFPEDTVVRFVAYGAWPYLPLDYVRDIPHKGSAEKGVAYILEPRFQVILPLLRRWYPEGVLEEHRSAFQEVMFLSYRVEAEEVRSVRGLTGAYYAGAMESDIPAAVQHDLADGFSWRAAEAPIAPPLRVRWEGGLYVPAYGAYRFEAETGGEAMLYLNGEAVGWGVEGEVTLPKGLHRIAVECVQAEADDGLRLYWSGPGISRQIIPAEMLCRGEVPRHGLEATYYRHAAWKGAPASIQLDPFVLANGALLEGTFSIVWRGRFYAPETGSYRFGTNSDDASLLYLDGELIVDNSGTHGDLYREGGVELTEGWHEIVIQYAQHGGGMGLVVYWTPPNRPRERLPETQLAYPLGRIEAPPGQLAPPPPMTAEPKELEPYTVGPLVVQWGKEGSGRGEFREPRGLAVDSRGRVYVADSGNRRVQVFDGNGRYLAAWDRGDQPFEVPWDVVVTSADEVLVLDAGPNWIYRFDAKGKYHSKFAGPEARLYQPRGMSIDARDNIYVADTGGHRVVQFDAAGRLVAEYGGEGSRPGQLLEPTDVAINSTGHMFVVDNSNRRVQRWDANGAYVGEWTIPVANAYNGPHLAMLPDDSFFLTVPEHHEFWRYAPTGEVLGRWGGPGEFRVPTDLALEGDDYLYVADTLHHQVQKFRLLRGP